MLPRPNRRCTMPKVGVAGSSDVEPVRRQLLSGLRRSQGWRDVQQLVTRSHIVSHALF